MGPADVVHNVRNVLYEAVEGHLGGIVAPNPHNASLQNHGRLGAEKVRPMSQQVGHGGAEARHAGLDYGRDVTQREHQAFQDAPPVDVRLPFQAIRLLHVLLHGVPQSALCAETVQIRNNCLQTS